MIIYLYIVLALIFAVIGKYTEKKWLNPISVLMILWALIMFLSNLKLYGLMETSEQIYLYIFLGLISFVIGYYINTQLRNIKRIQLKSDKEKINKDSDEKSLDYGLCFILLIICIVITIFKLLDYGFSFSDFTLDFSKFSEINRSTYNSKIINCLYEFVAYPLYNVFVIIGIGEIFYGKKDRKIIITTIIMIFMWMLVTGGRIAIIRTAISIIICLFFTRSNSSEKIKKISFKKKFLIIFAIGLLMVFLTKEKGFDVMLNFYTDFSIQPKLFEYWSKNIGDDVAFGSASLFGFIYPILYFMKNAFGLDQLTFGFDSVYSTINSTFSTWVVLGKYFYCNAYTSAFWYLYYDARVFGIIVGMLLWGAFSNTIYRRIQYNNSFANIAIYCWLMIGLIYSFTDMEFSKVNYVFAYFIIKKLFKKKEKVKK